MGNPFLGKSLWIWYVNRFNNGDLPSIVAECHRLNVTGVWIKAHDGGNVWPQFAQAVGPLKDAGLAVGAWGFCYGNAPEAEGQAALAAIQAGAQGYIADAEGAYETPAKAPAARTFVEMVAGGGVPTGLSSFFVPSYHPAFPFQAFLDGMDYGVPQVYWSEAGWPVSSAFETALREWSAFGKTVIPSGQAYGGSTTQGIITFGNLAVAANLPGITFYEASAMNPEQVQGVANAWVLAPGATGMGVKWVQTVLNRLGASLAVDGNYGPLTEAAVQVFQAGQRLPITGVVNAVTRYRMELAGNTSLGGACG